MAEHKITAEFPEDLEVATNAGTKTVPGDKEVATDDGAEAAWIAERAAIKVGNQNVKVESTYDDEQADVAMATTKVPPPSEPGPGDAVPMTLEAQTKASLKSSQEAPKKASSTKASAES